MASLCVCSVEGCGKTGQILGGMCQAHWRRYKKYGDPLIDGRKLGKGGPCSVEGCSAPVRGRGLCGKHYLRMWKHGDPLTTKKTPAGEPERWLRAHVGFEGEGCLIYPYALGAHGYAGNATVAGIWEPAYRQMCRLVHGGPPTPQHQAAHSCGKGDTGCVHPKHLRWATPLENNGDRRVHGTLPQGEDVRASKLTESMVRQIRELAGTMLNKEIAALVGTTAGNVGAIIRRETWEHLED